MKAFLSLFILLALFVFPGCGALDSLRGGPKKEPLEQKISSKELQRRNAELEQELQRTRDENELELARMKDENRRLMEKVTELQEESKRLQDKTDALEKKGLEEKAPSPTSAMTPALSKNLTEETLKTLKIKVLSGTGNLNSAKKMAARLKDGGYKVDSVDYAPRKNFMEDTVYFSPNLQAEAERLVSSLGGRAEIKPMTWPSTFDLIVVTGRNP